MKIAFVLGDESADRIGADLVRGLRRRMGGNLRVVGLGGDALRGEGLASLFDIEELSIIGIAAIVARFPQLMRRLRQTADHVIAERPDAVVMIDSFTFTKRVAIRVRKALPDMPIIDIVPPAIWAYRESRAVALAGVADHAICLFPFEPDSLREHGGPPATYVGHPLMSESHLAAIMRGLSARESEGVKDRPRRLLLLPGSRRGEIKRLIDDFGATFALLKERMPTLTAALPTVPRVHALVEQKIASWSHKPDILSGEEAKWRAFERADAALAASGTVSLELALAGVPMALAYKLDPIAYRFRGLVTGWTAALPNFIAGHPLVPEHFHELVRPEHLARRMERLLLDTPEREAQIAGFADIRQRMTVREPPGDAAARVVFEVIAAKATRPS